MNFFEQQAAAKRLSQRLVALFIAAVIAIVIGVDAVVVAALSAADIHNRHAIPFGAPLEVIATSHGGAIAVTSLAVLAVIVVASIYKMSVLSAGGSAVAESVGGERVLADTQDPLQKRLLNVVEEMALASGVPVPEVFVLENESGINAFAAGYTPANAAIAVTRGALENLSRSELQAVIAHEFSHVLNGDMRINTRLIGLLFGILVIALAGRFVMRMATRGGDRKNGGLIVAVMLGALAVMIIGYIGLFFGRLIQAAVARSRERLADSSAVQFTRDPQGLRNALVKIGALGGGSKLIDVDAESVAHLLFAPGTDRWFATHPPLEARIRTLDPSFNSREFATMAAAMLTKQTVLKAEVESPQDVSPVATQEKLASMLRSAVVMTPALFTRSSTTPSQQQVMAAATLRASLPESVTQATHDVGQARAMLLALALDDDASVQAQQLKVIATQLGNDIAVQVSASLSVTNGLEIVQRQPVLMLLLPTLRQLSRDERTQLLICLNGLLQRAGQISVDKYALRKLSQIHLRDSVTAPPISGRATLQSQTPEVALLLAVLAQTGHETEQQAREAYEVGLQFLLPRERPEYQSPTQWSALLDAALNKLDRLLPAAKELLIEAMLKTIAHDGVVAVREAELLRVVCATLHCPMPPSLEMSTEMSHSGAHPTV